MNEEFKLAHTICLLAAFFIGIYLGVFIGEGNSLYECYKDGEIVVRGAFWKGEIKMQCTQPTREMP